MLLMLIVKSLPFLFKGFFITHHKSEVWEVYRLFHISHPDEAIVDISPTSWGYCVMFDGGRKDIVLKPQLYRTTTGQMLPSTDDAVALLEGRPDPE